MKPAPGRTLVAEAAIGISVAAGAYLMGVEPLSRAAAEMRSRSDAQFVQRAAADRAALASRVAGTRDRLLRIENDSAFARDELETFSAIGRIAEEAGVRVETLEQLKQPQPPALRGAASSEAAAQSIRERRIGCSFIASGTYPQAAALIGSIQREIGLARVDSIRLTPAGDTLQPRVTMNVTTSHWWFDTAEIRGALDQAKRGGVK